MPEIREYYQRAQELHSEVWAVECEAIADDDSRDLITVEKTTKTGTITYDAPNMAAARRDDLRVRTRQWLMERLNPRYRSKSELTTRNLNLNITGKPADLANMSAQELS